MLCRLMETILLLLTTTSRKTPRARPSRSTSALGTVLPKLFATSLKSHAIKTTLPCAHHLPSAPSGLESLPAGTRTPTAASASVDKSPLKFPPERPLAPIYVPTLMPTELPPSTSSPRKPTEPSFNLWAQLLWTRRLVWEKFALLSDTEPKCKTDTSLPMVVSWLLTPTLYTFLITPIENA